MAEKKKRHGTAYGKVIDRVLYPANVYHWPAALKEAGIWCGMIIGSRLEKSKESDARVVVTLECHGGVVYDGFPLDACLLAEQNASVYGNDSFLVTPNEFHKSNLRRIVHDRRPETKPGTTRLAMVDRNTLEEIPHGPGDLPLPPEKNKCPRPGCNGELAGVPASEGLRACTYCKTFYGTGSGRLNERLPMKGL